MQRRTWLLVFAAACLVLVSAPVVWLLLRPAEAAGDPSELLAGLTPTATTAPATSLPDPGVVDEVESNPTSPPVPLSAGGDLQVFEVDGGPDPVRLEIAKLGVDASIDGYGVARDGSMDVPRNTRDVAWYRYGSRPGEPGSAVLAAHVDLGGRKGVFHQLRRLEPGDIVSVHFDDGSTQRFRVVARAEYEKDELPVDAIFSRQGDPVLTLITCGGAFNPGLRTYDSNVVVYAVPLEPASVPAT
jgi:LPXTG-site transpeptidase (sortase) family protein